MSDLMRDYKLSPEQAAGFVGNLSHESGDFKSLQEISPTVKGSRGGYGYAQWTGPRRRQFEAWAQKKGLDPTSYEANYGFLRHELDSTPEGAVLGNLRNASTVSDATEVVSNQFLRPGVPHMGSRKQRASAYLAKSAAPAPRTSAAPAATPVAPAGSAASRTSAKPSPAQMALPPPPPEQARIGSNRRGKDPVQVTLPRELTQNLSDRGIAQLATGGMGGNMARGVG